MRPDLGESFAQYSALNPTRARGLPRRFLRAFIVAPLVTPILCWAGALALALADPDRRHLALQAPFGGLEYILAVGVPIAYTATLVAGGRRSG